jgi:deoxyribonuclease-4
MKKKHSLLFGAHMSISGGIHLALERGESIGCTAIQIFTKSNRQWHAKSLSKDEIITFKDAWKQSSIQSIITHATYLINIGSPNKEIEKKSVEALSMELDRSASLGIPYLVLHPGSHSKTDEKSCIQQISSNLNKVLKKNPDITILLETMAGQGTSIGHKFEQLAEIIKQSDFKKQLGICFDTCHAFSAGYDFGTEKSYKTMWEQFDKIIGLKKLKAMHINDSKKEIGSCIDRHTDIGKGKIGLKAFELLFNDPRFFDIPKILETPKDDLTDDKRNLETIIGLLNKKTKKLLNYDE